MTFEQGGMKVTGFRLGKFAYVMDLKDYTPEIFSSLKGVEVLVMSALRERPSPAHLTMDEAIDFPEKSAQKRRGFPIFPMNWTMKRQIGGCQRGVELAYDGLEIPFNVDGK